VPPIAVRPFHRTDRHQVTALVNAHVEAVLPGVTVSPNAVLSQLEREPGETVVDPWVLRRHTLVAVEREEVVAAAHLLRYRDDADVGPEHRGAGDVRWLLHRPGAVDAANAVSAAALDWFRGAGTGRVWSDAGLPAPGVYGVPDRWPHVAATLRRAGFEPGGREEAVLAAAVDDLPAAGPAPLPGLVAREELGGRAWCVRAVLDARAVGCCEVESDLTEGGTLSRLAGWAEVWELRVEPGLRRRGIGTWLLGRAADRLRFAGARRLLDCAITAPAAEVDAGELPFLLARGFRELTRTRRGWRRDP
jgi:GNAT superfamily N-acetyltransferase